MKSASLLLTAVSVGSGNFACRTRRWAMCRMFAVGVTGSKLAGRTRAGVGAGNSGRALTEWFVTGECSLADVAFLLMQKFSTWRTLHDEYARVTKARREGARGSLLSPIIYLLAVQPASMAAWLRACLDTCIAAQTSPVGLCS